jgi:NADPH-dependent glutamate synthase beta subunit-like oxidoreductase
MTALPSEVEAAVAEGVEMLTLNAPAGIVTDGNGSVTGFRAQPQIVGRIGDDGRPAPQNASLPETVIPCDVVIMAVGQAIETAEFEKAGIPVKRGTFIADAGTAVPDMPGVFAERLPVRTVHVIRANASGKVAAAISISILALNIAGGQQDVSPLPLREKPLMGASNEDGKPARENAALRSVKSA